MLLRKLALVVVAFGMAHARIAKAQGATAAAAESASLPTPAASTVGIFSISVVGADVGLQKTAIDALSTEIGTFPHYKVVTKSDLEAMLTAQKVKDAVGCNDVSCLAEIGAAAGVEHIVAGSISKVAKALVISLQLVNTHFANVENRVTLNWDGSVSRLPEVLQAAAELLLLTPNERKPGVLRLIGAPAKVAVSVDGVSKGVGLPDVEHLAIGIHRLALQDSGYEPLQAPFLVRSGQTTLFDVHMLEKAESPFYSKWWFWTVVGVAVAGGVGTGIYLGSHSQQTGVNFTTTPPTASVTP